MLLSYTHEAETIRQKRKKTAILHFSGFIYPIWNKTGLIIYCQQDRIESSVSLRCIFFRLQTVKDKDRKNILHNLFHKTNFSYSVQC